MVSEFRANCKMSVVPIALTGKNSCIHSPFAKDKLISCWKIMYRTRSRGNGTAHCDDGISGTVNINSRKLRQTRNKSKRDQ